MKNEEYTVQEIREALRAFHNILVYIDGNYERWQENVKQCDMAICDIEHNIEINFSGMSSQEKTELVRDLYDFRKERRRNKDRKGVSESMIDWIKKNKINIEKLNAALNQAEKFGKFVENRTYTPRTTAKFFSQERADNDTVIAE